MKVAPFFSIIVPTYNSENSIKECLVSIISQTFSDFEVLIIDGVSNDNTLEIALSFNDSRIKIISESDNGIYNAMNKGIDFSIGKWLYFLGSDDFLFEDVVLDKIFDTIIKTKSKIIYGNVIIKGYAGWASDGQVYDGSFCLEKLLYENICHQSIFYNKIVFSKIGYFNERYKICADYDFNLKCWATYRFLYVDYVIAIFKGGNSSTQLIDENFSHDYWKNIVNYYRWKLYNPIFSIYTIQLNENTNNYFNKLLIKLSLVTLNVFKPLRIVKRKLLNHHI